MIRLSLIITIAGLTIVGCSKAPDIEGAWFFDYEETKLTAFPNTYYESARALIADVEPRYGRIAVEKATVVLGGAVCKIIHNGNKGEVTCLEKGELTLLDLDVKDEKLLITPKNNPSLRLVFSRQQQNPYEIYRVDANETRGDEQFASNDRISVPLSDRGQNGLTGLAKTANFDAFFVSSSIKHERRNSSVDMILNYIEPQNDSSYPQPVLSSVQTVEFDCPASNYRLLRFVMHAESNGKGVVASDSGPLLADAEWKPVPENSINKLLYTQICK